MTASRSQFKSSDTTNITINYQTLFGTSQHIMRVVLPTGQNIFTGTSGCFVGNDPCNIIDSNSTDMRISLKPNTPVTLTGVTNIYPNQNKLLVNILTYPEQQLV
jgi:hypothetical protein